MHRRVIPFASPGNIVPKAMFAGERSSPLLAKCTIVQHCAKGSLRKKPPLPKGGGGGDSVSPPGDTVPKATFSGRPGRGVPTGKQINRTP